MKREDRNQNGESKASCGMKRACASRGHMSNKDKLKEEVGCS